MRPMRGIALKLASVLVFIAMASLIKFTDGRVPVGEVVFMRSFFAIPVIVVWLALRGELSRGVRTDAPFGHFLRAFAGTGSMAFGFAALALLPLPEATAIGYAAPLLLVIFAAVFLGEKVGVWRISAVGIGMLGVLIVLSPRLSIGGDAGGTEQLGAILALIAAVMTAFAQVAIRKLVKTEATAVIVFWFSVNASLLSLLTLPFGWTIPDLTDGLILVLAGLMGGVGQILLTSSYREADASVIAPFEYASMLFALLIGWFFFEEIPSFTMLAGASLVVAAGVLIIWRENKLGKDRTRQRKAMSPNG